MRISPGNWRCGFTTVRKPENVKAPRVGPRWGLVQSDGKVLAAGILYAGYLGGDEGYTATACNGKNWFDRLFWLGTRRAPAGWHQWTLDFDAEEGVKILHNGKDVNVGAIDKTGLKGFGAVAVWGDGSRSHGQTVWVADLSVTLGGPANLVPAAESDPYDLKAAHNVPTHAAVIYTRGNAPATPKLEDLPHRESVSEYGITWTFEEPAPRTIRQWRLVRRRARNGPCD